MIKIDNEKDLLNILKIISEESVKKAIRTLNESTDDAQQNYLKMMQREESFYGVDLNEKDKKEKIPKIPIKGTRKEVVAYHGFTIIKIADSLFE